MLVAKDPTNSWNIYPFQAFKEAILMYNIGVTKKDPNNIQESLNRLTTVNFTNYAFRH